MAKRQSIEEKATLFMGTLLGCKGDHVYPVSEVERLLKRVDLTINNRLLYFMQEAKVLVKDKDVVIFASHYTQSMVEKGFRLQREYSNSHYKMTVKVKTVNAEKGYEGQPLTKAMVEAWLDNHGYKMVSKDAVVGSKDAKVVEPTPGFRTDIVLTKTLFKLSGENPLTFVNNP